MKIIKESLEEIDRVTVVHTMLQDLRAAYPQENPTDMLLALILAELCDIEDHLKK